MGRIPIRLGPFTAGINRLKARTQLGPNELWDAKGVFQTERGRLRACHEAGSSVHSTDSFTNLVTSDTTTEEMPRRVLYWQKAGKLVAANRYRAEIEDAGQLQASSTASAAAKDIFPIEFAGHLWLFRDHHPLCFFKNAATSSSGASIGYTRSSTQVAGNASVAGEPTQTDFEFFYRIKGEPCYVYHSYYGTGASITNAANNR